MILATLILAATIDTTAVKLTASPQRVLIEQSTGGQSVNFDLILENTTSEPLDIDEVQVEVRDRAGKLLLRRFVDGNGTRPSIRTIDVAEVPAGGKALVFNPFHRFEKDLELGTLTYHLALSSKDGEKRYGAQVVVKPEVYTNKASMVLPIKGRLIVYDGHDFLAHHRRWDYTIPGLQQLGFHTNFMRYSYDFVPVNVEGEMSSGDEGKNENWFGFGREVRAVADGTVAAIVDDQSDDRKFDPSSVIEHGTMRVWGNYVVIDHGHGEFGVYGHIRQGSARVKKGQAVKRGETVAAIGASGSSMFPHLHFELQTGIGTDVEGLPSLFHGFDRIRGARRIPVTAGNVDSGEIVESK
ncbi:MAG: M23 family metallopeptidase [Acidobacteriota bacterium]